EPEGGAACAHGRVHGTRTGHPAGSVQSGQAAQHKGCHRVPCRYALLLRSPSRGALIACCAAPRSFARPHTCIGRVWADLMGIQGKTPDPKHPGGTTLEQQAQWVTLSTAGNFSYLYAKGQNALRTKKCA